MQAAWAATRGWASKRRLQGRAQDAALGSEPGRSIVMQVRGRQGNLEAHRHRIAHFFIGHRAPVSYLQERKLAALLEGKFCTKQGRKTDKVAE